MIDSVATIRQRAASVQAAAPALRASGVQERARWLAHSAEALLAHSLQRSELLSQHTGLSVPMVRWALKSTLRSIDEEGLQSLAARVKSEETSAIAMLSVILAGNVFTAPVRGIVVPLLLGVPVLVKASSRETVFAAMLKETLAQSRPRLGAALEVVVFEGGDAEREAALTELAEAVAVYGSDETVASVASRCPEKTLIPHDHGVSAAYCGGESLGEASLSETVSALALDICAYDQRGCLSPQVVYVQETPQCSAIGFAEHLATEGLGPMARRLPRGPLPLEAGAAQAQWRGLAEAEGRLLQGPSYAISVRPMGPVHWSPGYRNVTVMSVESAAEALQALDPFAASIKCIGTDPGSRLDLETLLSRGPLGGAYACDLGQMQSPPLDAPADGRPIWHGLLRSQTPMKSR